MSFFSWLLFCRVTVSHHLKRYQFRESLRTCFFFVKFAVKSIRNCELVTSNIFSDETFS